MSGKTILITGSTDGLGRHLAVRLGGAGARVLVHGRDRDRAEGVRAEILAAGGPEPEVLLADLAALREVDGLAEQVRGVTDRLDVLINNAGVGFGAPGSEREFGADGYELRFAVNYLAGARLTRQLVPLLLAAAPARVVNVASIGQQPLDLDDLNFEHGYTGAAAYMRSKLAQIMFTFDLAEELGPAGVTVTALHPATYMDTTMVREFGGSPLSTVEQGGDAVARLLVEDVPNGGYFNGRKSARADEQAYDPEARSALRARTADLIASALH
ncbi:SDR family NAD(P)-dependent oxidoreductase [Nocardia sp. alder85J]|uniref:SDR family NAD(P)-dependent oxidoreductase n=1 Tax=Nocardia sp. alder85J TaxID=2862949 RepID=UPI001CD567E3|nr:SDR family NAD(P)-dependent oxidoreductase [Nocardia sp. alder85J]MCX4094942.1 SDR family NAD(P)-dependent oxidoreductase [Nocardia sp. alder85J]